MGQKAEQHEITRIGTRFLYTTRPAGLAFSQTKGGLNHAVQTLHHRRGQRRVHPQALPRHPVRAGTRGHEFALHRHQPGATSTWSRSSAQDDRGQRACQPKSPPPPTAAARSTAPTTSSTSSASAARGLPLDIDIPLKYGVDQCVGDTLCAGGIMYGQRNIPAMLDFCKDIREVAKPGRPVPQLRQPHGDEHLGRASSTAASTRVGLCHGVAGRPLADRRRRSGVPDGGGRHHLRRHQPPDLVHPGPLQGPRRSTGETARGLRERTRVYSQTEKVRIDVLRRFGYYSTESNGHLSRVRALVSQAPREIRKLDRPVDWINGETGGYLRVCTEGRNWFETDFPTVARRTADKPIGRENAHRRARQPTSSRRSRPAAPTAGTSTSATAAASPTCPTDCIVEVPGYVDRNGINIPRVGDLPLACAATCSASVNVQRMARGGGRRAAT